KFRDAAGVSLANTTFVPYDGYLGPDVNTISYLERMLEDPSSGMDKPAAVIVETVQGEGGVNVATVRWLKDLERLCRQHDMLLIRSEEHTSELQSRENLVCRLLLEKKNKKNNS